MDTSEYCRLAEVEDSHWWYLAMHRLVIDTCGRWCKGPTLGFPRSDLKRKILDAGCGSGGLTKKLEQFGEVVGLDISPLALNLANRKRLTLVSGSVNNLPFAKGEFDLIISVSVLYHRKVDDRSALKEFYRILTPGGKLLLILPAFSWAWGNHDEAVHARKRYTLDEMIDLLEPKGFKLIERRYIFSFLFPIFIIKRLMEKFFPRQAGVSDLEIIPNFLNNLLFWLCRVEWKLGEYIKFPFGSSLLAVGEKK